VKLERYAEAREELHRALAMTDNAREQDLLSRKIKQIVSPL
jgi:RNA polymerase sigma-70 factor, ECF subfamily